MFKAIALWTIGFYRRTGGGTRWFGIDCNFEPSCSAYSEEAIKRFGFIKGVKLTLHRLRRCNQPDAICKCIEPVAWDEEHVEARRS